MERKTLREELPHEALDGTFSDLPFNKHLDRCVIAEHYTHEVRWPGKHKNVVVWWELEGGYAVGWNENMAIGWTFPLIRYTVPVKTIAAVAPKPVGGTIKLPQMSLQGERFAIAHGIVPLSRKGQNIDDLIKAMIKGDI